MSEAYFECSECGNRALERDVIAGLPGFDSTPGNRVVFAPVQPYCVHDAPALPYDPPPLPMVRKGS